MKKKSWGGGKNSAPAEKFSAPFLKMESAPDEKNPEHVSVLYNNVIALSLFSLPPRK